MAQRLLIVDSDRRFIQEHQAALESTFEVDFLTTTDGALAQLESGQYSAVLLCVEVSENKGYSLCSAIRKAPGTQSMKVALISSKATEEEYARHQSLKGHADLYLHKPMTANALIAALSPFVPMKMEDPDNPLGDLGGSDVAEEWLESLKTELELELPPRAKAAPEAASVFSLPLPPLAQALPAVPKDAGRVELLEARVQDLEAKLVAKADELDHAAKDLEDLRQQPDSATRNLGDLEPWQAEGEQAAAALETRIQELEAQLAGRNHQVGDLEAKLAGRTNQVGELEAQLAGRSSHAGELEAQLASRSYQAGELEAQLAGRNHQLGELEAQLDGRNGQIRELEAQLEARSLQIGELETRTQEQAQSHQESELTLGRLQKTLRELEAQLTRSEENAAGLNHELSTAMAEQERKDAELKAEQERKDAELEAAKAQLADQARLSMDTMESNMLLQAQMEEARENAIQHLQTARVLGETQERQIQLEAQLQDKATLCQELEARCQQQEGKLGELEAKCSDCQLNRERLETAFADLEREVSTLAGNHERQQLELLAGIDERDGQLGRLNATLDAQQERLLTLERLKDELEGKAQAHAERMRALNELCADLEGKARLALDLTNPQPE